MDTFIRLLLNMSCQTAMIVCVVLLVRQVFQWLKVPKLFNYCLWMIPFIRMMVPWTLESRLSILPIQLINRWFQQILHQATVTENETVQQTISYVQMVTNPQSAGTIIHVGNNLPIEGMTQGAGELPGTVEILRLCMVIWRLPQD